MIYNKEALNSGAIFRRTCEILDGKIKEAVINLTNGDCDNKKVAHLDAALIVPLIVNYSFACELFLKALLPDNTSGHRLDKLFF